MSAIGRSRAVDLLKLALALMVVGIHANPFRELGRTAVLMTGDGIYRLGVPVFLLFNGSFLQAALEKGRGWSYVKRAATLYVLWMLLYLPIYWPALMAQSWWQNLRMALFGYWHLWYLSGMAVAAAILVPLAGWSVARLTALMGVTLAGGLALFYLQAWEVITIDVKLLQDPLPPHRNALMLCLPYMLMGMLIHRLRLAESLPRGPVLAVAALGILLVPLESVWVAHAAPRGFPHDTMITLAFAAPALMIAAMQWPGQVADRRIGDYASGIYFVHVAFVSMLLRHTFMTAPEWRPAVWTLAVLGSCAVVWLLRRGGLAQRLL